MGKAPKSAVYLSHQAAVNQYVVKHPTPGGKIPFLDHSNAEMPQVGHERFGILASLAPFGAALQPMGLHLSAYLKDLRCV
jgi:hypothetical protein